MPPGGHAGRRRPPRRAAPRSARHPLRVPAIVTEEASMTRHPLVWFGRGVVALALLCAGSRAPAAFVLTVQEAGGPAIAIADGGSLDQDGLADGIINVNTSALNVLLANFSFVSLGGTSNALLGGPDDAASISQTG